MSANSELGFITLTDSLGQLVSEPFNPADSRHVMLMELFADDCPECRAALARIREHEAAQLSPPIN